MNVTALIAEDEPLLAQALRTQLAQVWPQLQVLPIATNGLDAVAFALAHRPDLLFFDIQMPGQSGLDAVSELADSWGDRGGDSKPFPAVVFVTAFDQYAVQAFEAQALDYVLKPVQSERLARTVQRLQARLQQQLPTDFAALGHILSQLGNPAQPGKAPLQVLQASQGNRIDFVPIAQVQYFEAADKYLRVLTADKEYVVRLSLRELLPQLPSDEFWQVHRGVVVRVSSIASAARAEDGKLSLQLHGRKEKLPVSRLYAHRFRGM
jgi:DNA-binding LytR/AlgR family response regulator